MFDAVLRYWYARAEYYEKFRATVYWKYTAQEAAAQALQTCHYGPWE